MLEGVLGGRPVKCDSMAERTLEISALIWEERVLGDWAIGGREGDAREGEAGL